MCSISAVLSKKDFNCRRFISFDAKCTIKTEMKIDNRSVMVWLENAVFFIELWFNNVNYFRLVIEKYQECFKLAMEGNLKDTEKSQGFKHLEYAHSQSSRYSP
ncbi:uncharacterized protein LOC128244970 [Mya arenaria]|uniref:uncharacterized protein LOC128244970 n=1 Tax=Mya arenaria TaxID=6604 RepID=UPI0022E66045|nr:uncharacterized protein LOC128244970 [Mya arenaria]